MADLLAITVTGVYNLINDDILFGDVYATHTVADLGLPGITVGPESMEPREDDSFTTDGAHGVPWDITVSVRLHIADTGDYLDQATLVALVDDVVQKLRKNHSAIVGCSLGTVAAEFDLTFAESETVGAQVLATYLTHDEYTQE